MTRVRAFLVAGLTVAALGSAQAANLPVVGTGDGIEVLRMIAAAYSAKNPHTTVLIPPSIGSGGGIAAVGSDKEVLGRIARPLSEAERQQGLVATPLFHMPSAIFVHRSSQVTGLTSRQLADIYAGKIVNWREVGGADLRIKVVRREEADSTLAILRQSMPGWKDLVITERSKLAMTTQEAVNSVKEVDGAIGFGPYTKLLEAELTVLKIDGKYPTDSGYPSAVTVSLIHKANTITPEAKAFLAYSRTPEVIDMITKLGAVPVRE